MQADNIQIILKQYLPNILSTAVLATLKIVA